MSKKTPSIPDIRKPDDQTDEQTALIVEKNELAKAFIKHKGIVPISFNPTATQLNVPSVDVRRKDFILTLGETSCNYKKLLFAVLNAAHYIYFTRDDFGRGRKDKFRNTVPFWDFIKSTEINKQNRANILKDFETYRVKEQGVKPQSTGLKFIKLLIDDALAFRDFRQSIKGEEIEYLVVINKVTSAPDDEKNEINLNHWFSKHTWLRRDDIGIGDELYSRLSSPKALMESFRVTIETSLLQIQSAKDALILFFRETQLKADEIYELQTRDSFENQRDYPTYVQKILTKIFKILADRLASQKQLSDDLQFAIELIVYSQITEQHRDAVLSNLVTDKKWRYRGNIFQSKLHSIFHQQFIHKLVVYAETGDKDISPMPVCETEQMYFTWLMAYQTVQPSDIPKMTLKNFKFVKRGNGHITHIECDYWKSRSHQTHQVNMLKTSDDIGKSILRYIFDITAMQDKQIPLVPKTKISYRLSKNNLVSWSLIFCLKTSLKTKLDKKYQLNQVTPVFIKAFSTLIENGISQYEYRRHGITDCETVASRTFFGLSMVKTSAVYAQSDIFSPTTLVNPNSHSDRTERVNYLTPHNEEWQNNCGKVTRAVMRDLTVNLFRASQRDRELFNSEFTHATEIIDARSADVLSTLKMVTKKQNGKVNALGIIQNTLLEGDLPDTIYLQDSPETVMKLKHYVDQVQLKHKALKHSSPEYLLFTILPTVEWIETLFEQNSFKASIMAGEKMYEKYKDDLPPLFNAQLA